MAGRFKEHKGKDNLVEVGWDFINKGSIDYGDISIEKMREELDKFHFSDGEKEEILDIFRERKRESSDEKAREG